jgi:hypothetical protein
MPALDYQNEVKSILSQKDFKIFEDQDINQANKIALFWQHQSAILI